MSRSGYTDDCDDQWALIRWRGAVNSAIKGKRGQQALREILAALDALPEKRLASESLVTAEGECCTLGALGKARGIDLEPIDPEDRESVARAFGISEALAAEIMYINDEHVDQYEWIEVEICGPVRRHWPEFGEHRRTVRMPSQHVAEKRWDYMRAWVERHIATPTAPATPKGGAA